MLFRINSNRVKIILWLKQGWLSGLRRCIANAFIIFNSIVRRFESYSHQLLKITAFNKTYYFFLKLALFFCFWLCFGFMLLFLNFFFFFSGVFNIENYSLNYFFIEKTYLVIPFGLYDYPNYIFFDNYPDLTVVLTLIFRTFQSFLCLNVVIILLCVKLGWLVFLFLLKVFCVWIFLLVFIEDERPLSLNKLNEYKLFFKYSNYVVLKTRRQRTDEEKVRRFYDRVIRPGNVTKYIEENYLKKGEKF